MNKLQLVISVLLSTSAVSWAGSQQKKVDNWIDASVKAKTELQEKLKKAGMPVISQWMKHKQKAQSFVVDVKGLDKLVLVTAGGPDGTNYDQAVWANARLIKKMEHPFGWTKSLMNMVLPDGISQR